MPEPASPRTHRASPPGRDGSAQRPAEHLAADPTRQPPPDGRALRILRRVLAQLTAPEPAHELETARHARRAARYGALCARAALPLADLLVAYESCCRDALEKIWRDASTGRRSAAHRETRSLTGWLRLVCTAAADGYAAELDGGPASGVAVPALTAALLLGHTPAGLARTARCPLADGYRVLLGGAPGAAAPWSGSDAVAGLLDDEPVLHCVDGADLVVLLPPGPSDPRVDLLRSAASMAGVRWALTPHAPVSQLGGAVLTARRTVLLAYAAQLPAGSVSRPAAVAVEDLALGDAVLRPWLDGIGGLLAEDPDLLRTVEVLHATDLDRSRTAERIGVARRTLDGRLQRVHGLTGVNPTSTTGIQVLGLALAARRLTSVEGRRTW